MKKTLITFLQLACVIGAVTPSNLSYAGTLDKALHHKKETEMWEGQTFVEKTHKITGERKYKVKKTVKNPDGSETTTKRKARPGEILKYGHPDDHHAAMQESTDYALGTGRRNSNAPAEDPRHTRAMKSIKESNKPWTSRGPH